MSRASKNKNQNNSAFKNIMSHFFIAVAINIIAILIICLFFYITDRDIYDDFMLITTVISASYFLSSYIIGKRLKSKGMIYGLCYNLPTIMLILIISLCLNSFSFDERIFILSGLCILTSALGGITAVNSKSKYKRK